MISPPSKTLPSLRRRLLLFLLLPMLIVLGGSVFFGYRQALESSNEAYDHALGASVAALAAQIRQENGHIQLDLSHSAEAVLRTDPYDKVYFSVRDSAGQLVSGDSGLMAPGTRDQEANLHFSDGTMDGTPLRLVSYSLPAGATVLVAETRHKRDRATTRALAAMIWSNLLLIITALLVVYMGGRLALSPLLGLGELISHRSPDNLKPIPDGGVPTEAMPLLEAINRLMGNLRQAHQAQQTFITNAAHQLRTPIAGLQTQLELAATHLPDEERPRMQRLRDATRHLSHLTHQMLAFARSGPEADLAHEFHRVDLARLAEEAASEFLDAALNKNIDLGFEADPAPVVGSRWLLKELLANLIDNAIAYTPTGGRVTCYCGVDTGGHAFLAVEDDGPGIPKAARAHIFERFYRVNGSGTPGAGLGLAIVKEVAERHGAEVSISTPASGLGTCFSVRFPLATNSPVCHPPLSGAPNGS